MAMLEPQTADDFIIWGIDDLPYGPVELPVLGDWVKDERVLPETWVLVRRTGTWQRAADIPELGTVFARQATLPSAPQPVRVAPAGLKPGSLRRIKILAGLSDAQSGNCFNPWNCNPSGNGSWW